MRDFLWKYFSLTGEIDAYLLYKEHQYVLNDGEVPDSTHAQEAEKADAPITH